MGGYTSVNRVGMLWRALRGSGSRQAAAVLPFPWTRSLWLTLPLQQLTQETYIPVCLVEYMDQRPGRGAGFRRGSKRD